MNVLVKGPGVQNKKILNAGSVVIEIGDQKFVIGPSNIKDRLKIHSVNETLLIRSVNLFTITVEST